MKKYFTNLQILYSVIIVLLLLNLVETLYLFNLKTKSDFEIDNRVATVTSSEINRNTKEIVVDIKGEVNKPGVYKLKENIIIEDVIKLAGGFTTKAYKDNINLTKMLENEQVLYIYSKTEYKSFLGNINFNKCDSKTIYIDSCLDAGSSVISTTNNSIINSDINFDHSVDKDNSTSNTVTSLININNASASELTTLNGIGEKKAEEIVFYRTKNGPFNNIEEIKNVSGIGESIFEKIKDFITV